MVQIVLPHFTDPHVIWYQLPNYLLAFLDIAHFHLHISSFHNDFSNQGVLAAHLCLHILVRQLCRILHTEIFVCRSS